MKQKMSWRGTLLPLFVFGMSSSLILTALFAVLFGTYDAKIWLALSFVCGSVFYHFFLRFFVGTITSVLIKPTLDYENAWFREKPFERGIYKKMRVKRWKAWLPTFDSASFSLEYSSAEVLIQQTCHSESVHVIIFICSYLSLLFCLFISEWELYLDIAIIIAVLASLLDLLLIIVQRYNRPRFISLFNREKKRG